MTMSPLARLAILLPDGVGVRNFLLGSFTSEATLTWQVDILHAIPDSLLPQLAAPVGESVGWHRLLPSGDGRLITLVRNSLSYAHMYWARTEAMQRRLHRPIPASTWGRWAMTQTARGIGRLAASPAGIASLEQWHHRMARREPSLRSYRELFRTLDPDMLFCSHQRPPQVVLPVLAARSLGIPTATFIFSWDNLTSKGRIAAPFDHYLVWSDHMAAELLRYYPNVAPDRVHVVGSPQFDASVDPRIRLTRERFFSQIAADPRRPLICYSGGDVGTCPDDAAHVRLVMEMIRDGRIQGNPQLVVRPSPVDPGRRYDQVRADFPELRYAQPAWIHAPGEGWARVMPTPADVQFLANLTYYSDLNINVASTMTLDFAIQDRPVVNIAFDVSQPPPLGLPLHRVYYEYEHYRPVRNLGAARIARSAEQLAEHVNRYLADPALDRENRRSLVELEVRLPLGESATRILTTLGNLSRAKVTRVPELTA